MAKKSDANQPEIVEALRRAGASVQDLHTVGKGCPDIVVGWKDPRTRTIRTVLMEIKTPNGTFTKDEKTWWNEWAGWAVVVRSIEQALSVIGVESTPIPRTDRNYAQTRRG